MSTDFKDMAQSKSDTASTDTIVSGPILTPTSGNEAVKKPEDSQNVPALTPERKEGSPHENKFTQEDDKAITERITKYKTDAKEMAQSREKLQLEQRLSDEEKIADDKAYDFLLKSLDKLSNLQSLLDLFKKWITG